MRYLGVGLCPIDWVAISERRAMSNDFIRYVDAGVCPTHLVVISHERATKVDFIRQLAGSWPLALLLDSLEVRHPEDARSTRAEDRDRDRDGPIRNSLTPSSPE